jgi:transcription elongation factor GreA
MTTRLTQEGYDNLRAELDDLVLVRRPEISIKLQETSEGKDFEDNPEMEAVRLEQSFVEGRIKELNAILANAEIIKSKPIFSKVDLGATITVREDDGSTSQFLLVSPAEANPLIDKISYQSPFGKALLGKEVGEKVIVNAPDGDFRVEILKIE